MRTYLIALITLIAGVLPANAQSASGGLHGTLTDSSGAIIPNAKVAIAGNGAQKTTQTLRDGTWTFSGLTAGAYKVAVNFPGFTAFERTVTV